MTRGPWLARATMAVAVGAATVGIVAGCGGRSHRSTPDAAAVPAPAATAFGAAVNTLFNGPAFAPDQVAAQLRALRATGATLARSDVLWEKVEPTAPTHGAHHYDWSFDDTIAGALAAQHLTWLPILDYAASWAKAVRSQLHSPPRSASEFATFAGAFAARYGPGGTFWRAHPELPPEPTETYEVWNEPDGNFWYPAPNAAAYAELYARAREAIDAARPGSRVIIGGLAHPPGFLAKMIAARPRLAGHIDGVAIHVYRPPAGIVATVRAVRQFLDQSRMSGVPIYLTEVGWAAPPPRTERQRRVKRRRPLYIADTISELGNADCGLAAIVLFSWVTLEQDPRQIEEWYGIHPPPPHGETTPETQAFATAVAHAQRPASRARICGG